jgi:hypothetical protein
MNEPVVIATVLGSIISGLFLLVATLIASGRISLAVTLRNKLIDQDFNKSWQRGFKKARSDIFICGYVQHRVADALRDYKLNDNVQVRLLSIDPTDMAMLDDFCERYYSDVMEEKKKQMIKSRETYCSILAQLKDSKKNLNITDKITKRPLPFAIFAVDVIKPNRKSFIEIYYFIEGQKMSEKRVSLIAYSNTDLFNDLRGQIDFLWNDDRYKTT